MNYKIELLTKELYQELMLKGLIWKYYQLKYRYTYAVFPPNNEKPLIVTKEVWENYFKPLWDKGIYTYDYKKAIKSSSNPDTKWINEYRRKSRLNELYSENPSANQEHQKYIQSVRVERKRWTKNEKTEFRQSDEWKNFRKSMIKLHDCKCDECGHKFNQEDLEVHHLIESEDYDNLNPTRFLVLCKTCHDRIHNYLEEERTVKPLKKVKKIKVIKPKVKKIKKIKNYGD